MSKDQEVLELPEVERVQGFMITCNKGALDESSSQGQDVLKKSCQTELDS